MKLQKYKGQYLLTLPVSVVRGFGWEKHDEIEHRITGEGKIELSKKK